VKHVSRNPSNHRPPQHVDRVIPELRQRVCEGQSPEELLQEIERQEKKRQEEEESERDACCEMPVARRTLHRDRRRSHGFASHARRTASCTTLAAESGYGRAGDGPPAQNTTGTSMRALSRSTVNITSASPVVMVMQQPFGCLSFVGCHVKIHRILVQGGHWHTRGGWKAIAWGVDRRKHACLRA
jgi:hypothetical protein